MQRFLSALLLLVFISGCGTASSTADRPIDFSHAETCPPGYFHELARTTYFSNLYPAGFNPKQPEIGLSLLCPVSLAAHDLNQKVVCTPPGAEPIKLTVKKSADYVCTCRSAPWGIRKIYWGTLPPECSAWNALSKNEKVAREKTFQERRNATWKKLLGTQCHVADAGSKGIAVICSVVGSTVGTRELEAVKSAMPPGCGNLKLARFSQGDFQRDDLGFVFDCAVP